MKITFTQEPITGHNNLNVGAKNGDCTQQEQSLIVPPRPPDSTMNKKRIARKKTPRSGKTATPRHTKTVTVCGDLVWDTHIARLQFDPKGYFQPHGQTQLKNRRGGAWYLRDVVKEVLRAEKENADARVAGMKKKLEKAEAAIDPATADDVLSALKAEVKKTAAWAEAWKAQFDTEPMAPNESSHEAIEDGGKDSGGIAKGFSVWEWFEGEPKLATAKLDKDGKPDFKWREGLAELGAWRIKEFLGCQEARWNEKNGDPAACPALPARKTDLLLIDDLGLGFASHERCWPACLKDSEPPAHIIIKATPSFDLPLWKKLLAPGLKSKVTVVVSAAALRDYGARLSRGFSWDQTIQEVKAVFAPGGVGWPFRGCQRVVVIFGRSGAAVFSRVPRSPDPHEMNPSALQFERFVFDPAHLEETWSEGFKGTTFGTASIMTAVVAAHALMEPQPSSHLTVSRALAAARKLHIAGGGRNEKKFLLEASEETIFALDPERLPENEFRSAFPRELLDPPELPSAAKLPSIEEQTLLTDALGLTSTFLTVAAQDIVRHGWERALKSVPHVSYGKYFTVDREEIERLNSVRALILDYQCNRGDTRPLSLAVFGPPGSGKSFAIKQLSEALFGKEHAELEFNLSQFGSLDDLHEAFHIVRDKSVQGKMPFVFWDEFDSTRDREPLGWLKDFLAPMQDAKFAAKGIEHPFGKCIFIFAGGTCSTFGEFDRSQAAKNDDFRKVKGPDFVSRLRGYVNIKGPNPASKEGDEVHVIRRALLLRSMIERQHPGIIHPGTKELGISPTVLNAFLGVEKYLHGGRSMEAIVSLSRLHRCRHFGPSELPAQEAVELHVSSNFMQFVADTSRSHFTSEDIDALAKVKHESWMAAKAKQGYQYGPVRDDYGRPKTHPLLVPYEKLTEDQKEANRFPARLTTLRLEALGYRICPADSARSKVPARLDRATLIKLARSEHRRWTREKLLHGVAYAAESNEELFLHADLCKFDQLDDTEKHLDHEIIAAISSFLREKKLVLVKERKSKVKGRTKKP